MESLKIYKRWFVSDEMDFNDPVVVEEAFAKVMTLPVATLPELEVFIDAWMDVVSCIREQESRHYIAMTIDTGNTESERKFLDLVERVLPILEKREFELKKRFVQSPAAAELPSHYEVFRRNIKNEIALFREENIPLKTEDEKLGQRFQKIVGSWLVDWEGEKITVMKVRAKLEETDRNVRERAFIASITPHRADRSDMDALYDEMLAVRRRIAANAGYANYRDFAFPARRRFDYTPDECLSFHQAIKRLVVPLVSKLAERRKQKLGLSSIRPWDTVVDEDGRPPIRAFSDEAEFKAKVGAVLTEVDAEIGGYFQVMVQSRLLDLESRKGKAPGGYMADLPEPRLPFIFMNAVGRTADVETLLHESGHASHYLLCRDLKPSSYLNPPLEFAEVASMSMELLGFPFYNHVYRPEDIERVKTNQLSKILSFLPFMAMIDAFQHWVYLNPSTAETRGDYWEKLENEFRPHLDWTGIEDAKRFGWQYLHVFQSPFYYIEYGIAQLGALQVWLNSRKNYPEAIGLYKQALALGGSRPLPELFRAAGASFDMTERILKPLTEALAEELKL